MAKDGALAIGGVGIDRRGPSGPLAIALLDVDGSLIYADDGTAVHALLRALAASEREIVGLGAKGIVGAMLAIAPERAARLVDDVALGTWIDNVTLRNPGLDEVAAAHLGADLPSGMTPVQIAALTATVALASRPHLAVELRTSGTERLYREVELPLVEVLARMESTGIAVDRAALAQLDGAFRREIERLERAVRRPPPSADRHRPREPRDRPSVDRRDRAGGRNARVRRADLDREFADQDLAGTYRALLQSGVGR